MLKRVFTEMEKQQSKLSMQIRKDTENRIEALLTASQVTIDPETQRGLAQRINRLNLYYEERYGQCYRPQNDNENKNKPDETNEKGYKNSACK